MEFQMDLNVCNSVCVCVCEQQLDYDSRVVQRRLYQEALLEITLPVLARTMDGKWKTVGHVLVCSLLHSVHIVIL